MSGRRVELTALLRQIAAVAIDLPPGAEVTVTWWDAPPDLMLVLAMQPGGRLRQVQLGDGELFRAEWNCGGVAVQAQRSSSTAGNQGARLTLVKP